MYVFSLILPRSDSVGPFNLEDSSPGGSNMGAKQYTGSFSSLPAFIFCINSTPWFVCIQNLEVNQ